MFFRIDVLNGPLGKTQYYAIRVEFQVRGSPNIHSFIWILNTPKLTLILKVIENGLIVSLNLIYKTQIMSQHCLNL